MVVVPHIRAIVDLWFMRCVKLSMGGEDRYAATDGGQSHGRRAQRGMSGHAWALAWCVDGPRMVAQGRPLKRTGPGPRSISRGRDQIYAPRPKSCPASGADADERRMSLTGDAQRRASTPRDRRGRRELSGSCVGAARNDDGRRERPSVALGSPVGGFFVAVSSCCAGGCALAAPIAPARVQ